MKTYIIGKEFKAGDEVTIIDGRICKVEKSRIIKTVILDLVYDGSCSQCIFVDVCAKINLPNQLSCAVRSCWRIKI